MKRMIWIWLIVVLSWQMFSQQLQWNSPCRGAGDTVKVNGQRIKTDILGNPVPYNHPDLGAYQYQEPLPVQLISFKGKTLRDNYVELVWVTATEVNFHGFEIERKLWMGSPWEKIGFVAAQGNSNKGKEYMFSDKLSMAGVIAYRLNQVDNDGGSVHSNIIVVSMLPKEFTVSNYPNPFNQETTIRYSLPYDCKVRLTVYNVIGSKIESFPDEMRTQGSYEVKWRGRYAAVYILAMTTKRANGNQHTAAIKMVLLK